MTKHFFTEDMKEGRYEEMNDNSNSLESSSSAT